MHTNNWLQTALRENEGGDGASNGGGAANGGDTSATLLNGQEAHAGAFKPTYEGALNPDGTFAEGWTAKAFGTEYGDGPLSRVKSVTDLDKAFRDNMAAARGRELQWPGEKATPEQVAAIRRLTGAPETPDKYGDLRPETIPAELWDKGTETELQAVAHKHHLPPAALKDIMGLYAKTLDSSMQQNVADFQAHRAGQLQVLKQEFGQNFDAEMHDAKRFALTLGLDENNPVFNDASVVAAMARGAKLVREDSLVNGRTQGLTGTPQMQANAIMTDPTNPHYAKYQAGDPATQALVNNLLKQQ